MPRVLTLSLLTRPLAAALALGLAAALAAPAGAADGVNMSMSATAESTSTMTASAAGPEATADPYEPSYYQQLLTVGSAQVLESTEPGLPTTLFVSDSTGTATYTSKETRSGAKWKLKIRGFERPHEQVDAVYQMIAVLPLPVDGSGVDAFAATRLGIHPREGTDQSSKPLIYSGERLVLKRNVALERSLLPGLVGYSSIDDKLPSLQGTGYEYTLWDTIVRYDPSYGDTVQVIADVAYSTNSDVSPPDAADERLKAYVITWIPGMDPRYPLFTVRIDIVGDDGLGSELVGPAAIE
jgi:hypothetical protein